MMECSHFIPVEMGGKMGLLCECYLGNIYIFILDARHQGGEGGNFLFWKYLECDHYIFFRSNNDSNYLKYGNIWVDFVPEIGLVLLMQSTIYTVYVYLYVIYFVYVVPNINKD